MNLLERDRVHTSFLPSSARPQAMAGNISLSHLTTSQSDATPGRSGSNFFGQLVIETDEARRSFETHPVVVDAVANGMSVHRYRRLLLEIYHVVWHFNPISAAAASRVGDSHRDVRYFLYDHIQEEKGHELWVLNDLRAIGTEDGQIFSHQPSVYNRALTGYNYWVADRGNACAVLGMLYCLEVIASVYGGPFSNAIQESLLLDGTDGVSFLGSHASMDAKHMADLRHVLNTIEDRETLYSIVDSTTVNFHHFTQIIAAI